MKRQIVMSLSATLFLLALLALPAYGQGPTITVNIPFEFSLGDKAYPAGEYAFSACSSPITSQGGSIPRRCDFSAMRSNASCRRSGFPAWMTGSSRAVLVARRKLPPRSPGDMSHCWEHRNDDPEIQRSPVAPRSHPEWRVRGDLRSYGAVTDIDGTFPCNACRDRDKDFRSRRRSRTSFGDSELCRLLRPRTSPLSVSRSSSGWRQAAP
jgi:hypothetical protein